MKKKLVYAICASMLTGAMNLTPIYAETISAEITYNYDGENHTRQMENLGRGLVAVKTNDGVYLSWRLLGTEGTVEDILMAPDFVVYKNGTKLAEVENSTNYLDESGKETDKYTVALTGGEQCESVSVWNQSYTDITLDKPAAFVVSDDESYEYTAGDASCGDLDGDGEYELVLKWDCNAKDSSHSGITGNVYLDAYELDGTKLWRIDLGRNIRAGAHYTQYLVYDFDLDGVAEITCKTAPGSIDANGDYVSAASSDSTIKNVDNTAVYINKSGYILEGEEFFTIFDGKTGAALDTINYPNARVSAASWGDNYGNRCDRFIASVAYVDGEKPYAVYWRGYYGGQSGYTGRTGIFCASFDGEKLSVNENHVFDTLSSQSGYTLGNEAVIGQGNHNMTVADVDDDGKDEFMSGAVCFELDDSGKLVSKWNTGQGHGDALHIGDYDPTHIGLEYFTVHESSPYGSSVIDPATGEILFHNDASADTGRGLMANVGAGGYYQIADAKNNNYYAMGNGVFEAGVGIGSNFRIFWDGDLYDETLNGTTVSNWNDGGFITAFSASGCVQVNGTKANPALQADLFGDWREELVYPTSDNSKLRVYTTTDVTNYKLPTLMHDPVYRSGVASEQSAYNQPPHVGFYLAEEIFNPDVVGIEVTKLPDKTTYFIGDNLDTEGMVVTANYNDGSSEEVTGYIVSGYDKNSAGEQVITVTYSRMTTEFTVTVDSGFVADEYGYITDYHLSIDTATLPEAINGKTVIGFADGALVNSSLKTITILADQLNIGENVFPQDIKIICYPGTDIYNYAVENSLNVETIDTYSYTANITYSEDGYTGYSMLQTNSGQTQTIGHIIYTVGGRGSGGDGKSGFSVVDLDGEKVLNAGVGRFSDKGRNARFVLSDIPMLSDETDSVFETDIMFLYNDGRRAVMTVYDSSDAVIDTVSVTELGIETDIWYTYKLICHKGIYYRMLCERGTTTTPVKIGTTSSEYGVTTFTFTKDSNGTNIGNNQSANIYFDNTKIYTNTEIANLTLNVVDEYGNTISKPDITLNGEASRGDANGTYNSDVFAGTYNIVVSADGYEEQRLVVGAYKIEVQKTIVLEAIGRELTGIKFTEDTLALKTGTATRVSTVNIPENAKNEGVTYSSSNEAVAVIDENGVVTAKGAGTATLTATSITNPEISGTCTVTVVATGYTSTLTTVRIYGDESAYIPNTAGADNAVKFTAKGFDQYGVEMTLGSITWTVTGGLTIKSGTVTIPSGTTAGTYTVSAKSRGITGTTTLALKNFEYNNIIAYEDLDELFYEGTEDETAYITQGTASKSDVVGDITYTVGARTNGGDNFTGFVLHTDTNNNTGRPCLAAQAGEYASSNRWSYMTFNNATSDYSTAYDYVIETDIYFYSNAKMVFCDSTGTTIFQLDVNSLALEQNVWYHFMLIYSEGKYTLHITDENGDIITTNELSASSDGMINTIQFHKGDGEYSIVYLSELKYYTVKNALTNISIMVKDKHGNAVNDALVTLSNTLTGTTDSNGRAVFTLPVGLYSATATAQDTEINSISFVVQGSPATYTIAATPDTPETAIVSANNNTVVLNNPKTGYTIYVADYSGDGSLAGVSVLSSKASQEFYVVETDADKVFLWNGMIPVDMWEKGE